jgi:maltose alpha-D-glucosyltransferase/alpha-amylase
MLRSFDYAARSAITNLGADRANQVGTLEGWARFFEQRIREAFLEGYAEGKPGSAVSHPEDERQSRKLIELFTLERALYEVWHELNNRPDWVSIPIKGILAFKETFARRDDA